MRSNLMTAAAAALESLVVITPICVVPWLWYACHRSLGAGMKALLDGMPDVATTAAVFGLTAVIVAAIWAGRPRWVLHAFAVAVLALIENGAKMLANSFSGLSNGSDGLWRLIQLAHPVLDPLPLIVACVLGAAGIASCCWLAGRIGSRYQWR